MKRKSAKKLLSITLALVMLICAIPISGIVASAEEVSTTVLYASEITNNTDLTLNSNTKLIMDKTLYLKSIMGAGYDITITGDEALNIASAKCTIEVETFRCSAPLLVTSTSEAYVQAAIYASEFIVSGPELVLYGNWPLYAYTVDITAKVVNIRALGDDAIYAKGTINLNCETIVINSEGTALNSAKRIKLIASKYCTINSNADGICTRDDSFVNNNSIYLGGRITINAKKRGFHTTNGSIYSGGTVAGNNNETPALELLNVTAAKPFEGEGIINFICPDAKITATGENEPGMSANTIYLEGVYDIKTNGGHGLNPEYIMQFYKGCFNISGAKGDFAAVKSNKEEDNCLRIAEGLEVQSPSGGYFDDKRIYDSAGNLAKELSLYSAIDTVEIQVHKPVAGMTAIKDKRAIAGDLPEFVAFSEIKWYEDGTLMGNNDVFAAGKTYSAEVILYGEDYRCFPSGYMGKVNGKSVTTGLSSYNQVIHLRPNFGTCPKAITEVALNITTPVEGKGPSNPYTNSGSAYYVSSQNMEWTVLSNAVNDYVPMTTSTFEGGRSYRFSFDVIAHNGYGFPVDFLSSIDPKPTVTATVNGNSAYVAAVEEALTSKIRVTFIFGECNDTIIENIRIDVTPPKAGEYPDYTAKVSGTGYHINTSKNNYYDAYWANEKWYYVKNGVSWWDVTDGGYDYVYDNEVFLPDHKYQCEVYVQTNDGYEFVMDLYTNPETWPSVTVNGYSGEPTKFGSGLQFEQEVSCTFDCSTQSLSETGVTELSKPLAGANPDYTATTFAPNLYEVTKITWYDALGEELPADTTFIAGKVYRVDVQIETKTVVDNNVSYQVALFNCYKNYKTSLNGTELEMINLKNANKEDLDEYFNHAYFTSANKPINLCYTFKPAPQPTMGDINFDDSVNIKDLIRLKRIIAGLETNITNADPTLDGKVNSLDITFIRKFLLQQRQ